MNKDSDIVDGLIFLGSIIGVALALILTILLLSHFVPPKNSPTILEGKIVNRTPDSITIQYCEQHSKVSDKIVNITLQIIQSGQYARVNRYYERVGYC